MTARPGPAVGVAFLVLSNGLTATVDATAKFLAPTVHGVQVAWGYALAIFALLVCHALLRPTPLRETVATGRLALQLLRPALLVLTISTLFVGLAYVPLAEAIAIAFAAPLFIAMLSGPVLGEPVSGRRWVAVVAGFAGVALIVRPGGDAFHWAALVLLASAVFFACFQIATRALAPTERTFTTLFYTGAGAFLWSSIAVVFVWKPIPPSLWPVFAVLGALGVAAHLCMIKAFEAAEASLLAPFNYVKLLWGVVLGFAVFGEIPEASMLLGAAIIVASGVYVLRG